jgi:hypothetical protein
MTDRAITSDRACSSNQVRQQVMDYLLGALDDSEMEAVRARLESDPLYRQAMRRTSSAMVRLQGLGRDISPPPRLARRTCEFVFDRSRRLHASGRPRVMTPVPPLTYSRCRLNWTDAGVAAVIFLVAGLLTLPAINGARFQYRVTACKDNLRQVGQSLTEYSQKNNDLFPVVPVEGNLAAAGVYAPILVQNGFLDEPQRVLCPDSSQAQQEGFSVPSLDELRSAVGPRLSAIQVKMGGSYGYSLGYIDHGIYQPTRNLNREFFAVMADAPSLDRPHRQSANHGGFGQNVLFEDRHVEFCCNTRPHGGDDIFANDNGYVAPGLNPNDAVIAASGIGPAFGGNRP